MLANKIWAHNKQKVFVLTVLCCFCLAGCSSGSGGINTLLSDEPAINGSADEARLRSVVVSIRNATNLATDYSNGLRPKSNGYISIGYNPNGSLDLRSDLGSKTIYSNSQPGLTSEDYTPDSADYDDIRAAYAEIGAGTYDFAQDKGFVAAYFFGSGSAILDSLTSFQGASNNDSITEAVYSSIKNTLTDAPGSNAAIIYQRNDDGMACGLWVVLNIHGYTPDADMGCQLVCLHPDDGDFGKVLNVKMSDY